MRITTIYLLLGCLVLGLAGCSKRSSSLSLRSQAAANSVTEGGSAEAAAEPDEGFAFPKDQGGQLLAELLTPAGSTAPARAPRSKPLHWQAAAVVERPELRLPLTSTPAGLPQAALTPAARPVRPRLLPDDPPWSRSSLDPASLPERQDLPAGPRVRLPGLDVEQPVTVPILANPVVDKASLDDPTASFSATAAMVSQLLERSAVPFVRFTLPDPFEHSQTVRLRTPPPEEQTPSSPGPRSPGP